MIAIPSCVVCVAPTGGRARLLVERGAVVVPGQVLAVVRTGQRASFVRAPTSGTVGGTLTGSDQTVSRGEGVLWLLR